MVDFWWLPLAIMGRALKVIISALKATREIIDSRRMDLVLGTFVPIDIFTMEAKECIERDVMPGIHSYTILSQIYSFLWEIVLTLTTCNSNKLKANEIFKPLAVSIYQMKNTSAAPEQASTKIKIPTRPSIIHVLRYRKHLQRVEISIFRVSVIATEPSSVSSEVFSAHLCLLYKVK